MNNSNDKNETAEGYAPEGLHLASWPDVTSNLIKAINSDEFPQVLFESINRIAPIDSAIVMVFRADEKPTLIYDGLHPSETTSFYEDYMAGAYLLSPLYRRYQTMQSGFYRLASLEQSTFERSEFGLAYFNDSGLCDEANYLFKLSDEVAVVACFGRQQLPMPFTALELHQLHVAEPVFRAAIEKHWKDSLDKNRPDSLNSRQVHEQLKASLSNFGCSVLTERELEVMHMMFEGKASKTAAKELNISPDTERGHRKNIYSKLNVASQAELFSLVFAVISEVEPQENTDPLLTYKQA